MKTYVITLAERFPIWHFLKGRPTHFARSVKNGKKIHTIQGDYAEWERRFRDIESGEACLSLRRLTPDHSRTCEVMRLTREDGIGIERLLFADGNVFNPFVAGRELALNRIAENDVMVPIDWIGWFKNADKAQAFAIIHFTTFRYSQAKWGGR